MRRRRSLAAAVVASLLLLACGGDPDPAGVEVEQPEESDVESDADPEPEPEPDPEEPSEPGSDEDVDDQAASGTDREAPAEGEPAPEGPQPDASAVEDPCAAHTGREDDMFIDLVAPVDEQVATDEVEIVGCSNVFEANVVWNLLDGDGVLLDEGFTTAECGTGCVGAFRDTVPLDAAEGEPVAYLQVFSPNMSDEGDDQQALNEVIVVLE